MLTQLLIIIFFLLLMLCSILLDWKIKTKSHHIKLYWIITLLCALTCIVCNFITPEQAKNVFINTSNINPLKILIIFLSCASISILLDQIGFFEYLANKVAKHTGEKQLTLFLGFNILITILTIFTSNDILILTFTPFICYFAKKAKIDPTPYLVSEFVTANTWSMFLIIGNPTNIYLSSSLNIDFITYSQAMFLPTISAGITSFIITMLLFGKKLRQPIQKHTIQTKKIDKRASVIGICGILSTIFLMSIASWAKWELWLIPLITSLLTYLSIFVYLKQQKQKTHIIHNSVKKLPLELVPFLLSMGIIVTTLNNIGIIKILVETFSKLNPIQTGLIAFLAGNIINNIPMSMLFSEIFTNISTISSQAIFSVVSASNICAFLTPIGSLAGIMFLNILKENNIKFTNKKFVFYGIMISIPTFLVTLFVLNFS